MTGATTVAQTVAEPSRAPREFAPGVETAIPRSLAPGETVTRHDVVELLASEELDWRPKLLPPSRTLARTAAATPFLRDVWCLDFSFKPLRMIRLVDPAAASGQRLVWYLVYRVKNTGEALSPRVSDETGGLTVEATKSGPIRFQPHFVLEGHDTAPDGGRVYRSYLDRVLPEAAEAIRRRELPGRTLETAVTMPLEPLAEGEERWGVAMWTEVDPEMDFFSVYVRGLTNVYEWTDPEGAYRLGDPPGEGREFARKVLQLNFWRPGDRFLQHENEVRYGVAPGKASLYGVAEGVDHAWVYR